MTKWLDADDFQRRLDDALAGRGHGRPSLPCSPWDRWVLVALHRHVARQKFVDQVVRERLSGSPESIARFGAFEHPDAFPSSGEVPGISGWCYRFHGRGCCLTHEDGTELDVDFDEHGFESVDPWFYEHFLATKPDLGWLESLLRDEPGWKASIHPLLSAGLLEGEHRVRITPRARDWCDAVSEALDSTALTDARLRAVVLAVEDFGLAAQVDPASASPELRAAAELQIKARCSDLEARLTNRIDPHAPACLAALRSLDAERARAAALADLRHGPIDEVLCSNMEMLGADPRPTDIPAVHALLARLETRASQIPVPALRILAARHLLAPHRRGTVPEDLQTLLLDALAEDQCASEGEAALIVYLLDAERGLVRMVAGLRSGVPLARGSCAAALALVGGRGLELLRRAESTEASAVLALLRGDAPEPGPEPRGRTIIWAGKPKQVFTIGELLAAEFEELTFARAKSFWAEHESWLRRWDAN